MERIYIFDTTLRDGEQSAGAALNMNEKFEIAKQLTKLGVDVIEAGFPISSQGEFEVVRMIAERIEGPTICALARARKEDIDRAYEALKPAKRFRIHTFISTSDIHIKYQLKKTYEEVLQIVKEMVSRAKEYTDDVEFSPMDATRSHQEYLYQVLEAAIDCGATVVNIPDTVGYSTPDEFSNLIRSIRKNVSNINKAMISVHCHNDLGMATANSLAALNAGARQIECTINGIGERAGNTALEEVVMAIATRSDLFNFTTDINTTHLYKTSKMVSHYTGIPVQPNKAIVGANAFTHESGIHQDGVLKERTTYEIMKPQVIGLPESRITLGKLSGSHAFKETLLKLGYELSEEELKKAFVKFKELADKKAEIFDEDLEAIIEDEIYTPPELFHLEYIHVVAGNQTIPTATVKIKKEGEIIIQEAACGNGPVDAVYKAIDRITSIKCELIDYSLKALTGSKDAVGEVTVKVRSDDEVVTGRGMSTDVIEASAKAYLNAINRLVYKKNKENKARQRVKN